MRSIGRVAAAQGKTEQRDEAEEPQSK